MKISDIANLLVNHIKDPLTTKEEYKQRHDICKSCEHYRKFEKFDTHYCNDCKCVIELKARVRYFKCPLDKWPELD
jgi:hypothetical protein